MASSKSKLGQGLQDLLNQQPKDAGKLGRLLGLNKTKPTTPVLSGKAKPADITPGG